MKKNDVFTKFLILFVAVFLFSLSTTAQVGIGTTVPTESLDVVGNVKFSGSLMPNNNAGNAKQVLLSEGPGASPSWGLELLNTSTTTQLGKYFSGLFNISSTSLMLTITDPACTTNSTCSLTWINLPNLSGVNWSRLSVTISAYTGYWIFYIRNDTGYGFTNMQFSFFAAY